MEGSTVSGLRSRSRSKTPFLRSSCDHEHCSETEEHTHKSGRKTPIKRSTPIKQLQQTSSRTTTEVIREESEELVSPPAARTRQSMKAAAENLVKTSDYSSEESLDRLRGHTKEIFQNEVNSQYERVSTTSRYQTLADLTLSPIHASNITADRSTRFSSPAHSACSTDSSFAEQALADASCLLDRDPNREHLPYRLYKMAGEYWNKYPKTDYTYSPLSKDRVELAPGQVAVPNMSRRSLSQFRVQGPNTSVDEVDLARAAWTSSAARKRYTSIDSSDDESYFRGNGGPAVVEQRWWLTRLLLTVVTTITSAVSSTYRRLVGPAHRYPYTERRPQRAGILSRSASAAAAPFYWIYTVIKTVVTTTVTTVTETFSDSEATVGKRSAHQVESKRRWWPWLLLLLLPALGYGSYYTYENLDTIAPNFTDFHLDLSEFTPSLPSLPSLPALTLPNITIPSISLPDINITLPDIRENLPEVSKTYIEYRDIVHNRMLDASDYMKVVAESCFEEMRRFWHGVLG